MLLGTYQVDDLLRFSLNLSEGSIQVPQIALPVCRRELNVCLMVPPLQGKWRAWRGQWFQRDWPSVLSAVCEPGPCTWIFCQESSGPSASLSPQGQLGRSSFGKMVFLSAMGDQFGRQIRILMSSPIQKLVTQDMGVTSWTSQALKYQAAGQRWKAGRVPHGGNLEVQGWYSCQLWITFQGKQYVTELTT